MQKYGNIVIKQAKIDCSHTKLEKERKLSRKLYGTLNEPTGRSSCITSIEQNKSKNVLITEILENSFTVSEYFSTIGGQRAKNFVNKYCPLEYVNERNHIRF